MERTPVVVLRDGARADLATRLGSAWDEGRATWTIDPSWPAARVAALGGGLLDDVVPSLLRDGSAMVELPVPSDTATIVTSSGTTGAPKVLVLTAAALDASADGAHALLGATRSDRWLLALPLHHVAGQSVLWRSRRLGHDALVQSHLDPAAATTAGATLVALVPTQLRRVVEAGQALDATVLLGGGAISPRLLADAAAGRHVHRVVRSYGLTETAGGCVYDGWAFPGTEVTTHDGRLHLRGPTMAAGRLAVGGMTSIVDDDEWLPTHDLGAVAGDGRVSVTGRADDVIITGGVKVAPAEVEAVLEDHPSVVRAGVVGRRHAEWGEEVVAAVVTCAPVDPDVLRAVVRRSVGSAAVPRAVVEVDELPLTGLGKVDRRALRNELVDDEPG